MGTRDWRSSGDYADLVDLPVSGWAWEFLRRNPEYRAEVQAAESRPRSDNGVRWGLTFRRKS